MYHRISEIVDVSLHPWHNRLSFRLDIQKWKRIFDKWTQAIDVFETNKEMRKDNGNFSTSQYDENKKLLSH